MIKSGNATLMIALCLSSNIYTGKRFLRNNWCFIIRTN